MEPAIHTFDRMQDIHYRITPKPQRSSSMLRRASSARHERTEPPAPPSPAT